MDVGAVLERELEFWSTSTTIWSSAGTGSCRSFKASERDVGRPLAVRRPQKNSPGEGHARAEVFRRSAALGGDRDAP